MTIHLSQADLNGFPIDTSAATADFEFGKITEVNKVSTISTQNKEVVDHLLVM